MGSLFFICNSSPSPTLLRLFPKSPLPLQPKSPSLRLCRTRKTRGRLSVVTRAGSPGTGTYIFAFVLPLSLIAVTVLASIRIADKLDRDFLEEMAINQAIMEAEEEEEDADTSLEEKPSIPRTRNRPKREAETSSM